MTQNTRVNEKPLRAPIQDPVTIEVMDVLQQLRLLNNDNYYTLSAKVDDLMRLTFESGAVQFRHRLTSDQYRAMEQGMTKDVPVWVVSAVASLYGVPLQAIFAEASTNVPGLNS